MASKGRQHTARHRPHCHSIDRLQLPGCPAHTGAVVPTRERPPRCEVVVMHAHKKWFLATVAAAVVALGTPAALAGTTPLTMAIAPTSGPPGTAAVVSSVDPCPNTDGVF